MKELNKGYEFTKAQIAELESLRAWKAEIEKQEPVAFVDPRIISRMQVPQLSRVSFQAHLQATKVYADSVPLFAAPVVSPDVDKLKAELREISEALNDPADNLTKTTAECIKSLKTELKAARKDADRYRWLRNDPPVWLAVRRFPGETPRGCYLDGRNLDDAIDEAIEQAKGGA